MSKSREMLVDSGWCRGVFINLKCSSSAHLVDEFPAVIQSMLDTSDEIFLIPVLNDCALIHESEEVEPYVSVLICKPCDKNPAFCNAKNPRQYHFPMIINGEEVYFEILARNFFVISRMALLGCTPLSNISWVDGEMDKMLNWITDRIRQPTFPDEWNARLSKKQKKFKVLWSSFEFSFCSGIYFNIVPFRELNAGENYELKIIATIPDKLDGMTYREFNNAHSQALIERISGVFAQVEGVKLSGVSTLAESQFTKDYERNYKRWILEYYSYKSDPPSEIPSEYVI